MDVVAASDSDFNVMVSFVRGVDIPLTTLSQAIQSFRRRISADWFSQFFADNQSVECMTAVWKVLFDLVDNDDPGVRISVFSAFGSLVFALGAFVPKTTVASFLEAVQDQPHSKHRSIAVVACFCHVSRFVSAIKVQDFVSKLPIVHHLGVGLSEYMKYLPKLFSIMTHLDTEFERVILRTLLINFGEAPTIPFVAAVVEIVRHQPDVLFPDLMQYVKVKSLKSTMLMLTNSLLNDESIAKFSSEEGRNRLFELAISVLSDPSSKLNEFEEACRSLSVLLTYVDRSQYSEKMKLVQEALSKRDIPPHMRLFALQICDDLESLKPEAGDSTSLVSTKLRSLALMFIRNPSIDNLRSILNILWSSVHAKGEAASKFLDALALMFSKITVDMIQSDSYILSRLKIILELVTRNNHCENWVQGVALVHFLQAISKDVGRLLLSGFEEKVFQIVFGHCFSKQVSLSQAAVAATCKLVTYDLLDFVNGEIFRAIDLSDSGSMCRAMEVLNNMVDIFGVENFEHFREVAEEAFMTNTVFKTACETLRFLNKVHSMNSTIYDMCLDLIAKVFKSFTGQEAQLQASQSYYTLPPVSQLAETDILSRPFDEQSYLISTIQNSLKYIGRFDVTNDRLAFLVVQTLKLFPKESVKIFVKRPLMEMTAQTFRRIAIEVMETTSSTSVAASCVHSLMSFADNHDSLRQLVLLFLEGNLCHNGRDLFYFYSYMSEIDDTSICSQVYSGLSVKQRMLFDFLKHRREHLNDIQMYMNWLLSYNFGDWPIEDSEFRRCLVMKIGLIGPIDIADGNLSHEHVAFVAKYRSAFSDAALTFVEKNQPELYDKLFDHRRKFEFCEQSVTETRASAQFIFRGGETCDNIPLVMNFFRFSDFAISAERLDRLLILLKDSMEGTTEALKYALKFRIAIDRKRIDEIQKFEAPETRFYLAKYLFHMNRVEELEHGDLPVSGSSGLTQELTWFSVVVQTDPMKYFSSLTTDYKFSTSTSKELCILLLRFDVPLESVASFVKKGLHNLYSVTKTGKLVYFLRVVNIFFYLLFTECTKEKNFKVEFMQPLLMTLMDSVGFVARIESGAVHAEMAHLLEWVPYFGKPSDDSFSYFDTFHSLFGSASIYLPATASYYAFGGIQTRILTNDAISSALYSNIPSRSCHALRCMTVLLHPNACANVAQYFTSMYKVPVEVFKMYKNSPAILPYLLHAIRLVAQPNRPNTQQLRQWTLPELTSQCNRNSGDTAKKILEIITPAPRPSFSSVMREFVAAPTLVKGEQLIHIAKEEDVLVGCATMLLGNILVVKSNFLVVALVFRRVMKLMDDVTLAGQKEVINTMIESLNLGKRGEALKIIVNDGNMALAAELAAQYDCVLPNQ